MKEFLRHTALVLFVAVSMTACGTQMRDVMRTCDRYTDFSGYAGCIKRIYTADGRSPNSLSVKAFFSHLEAIDEGYRQGKISNARARSLAYDAFIATVQADNDRSRQQNDALIRALGAIQQQSSPLPAANGYSSGCTLQSQARSGLNKICYYNCAGSIRAENVGAAEICPLSR
jgi:hypothetical protein